MKRSFLEEIKYKDGYYFDPYFAIGFGEDRDLWKRVRKHGKETYGTEKVRIYHQGNATVGKIINWGLASEKSMEYLKNKYS
jgi:GT2 family glycosyltransferase